MMFISEPEEYALYELLDEVGVGKMEAARILRIPYHLVEYLIVKRERERAWEEAEEEEYERQCLIEQILGDIGLVLDSLESG